MFKRTPLILCLVTGMLLPSTALARGHGRGANIFGMMAAMAAQRAAWMAREKAAEAARAAKNNQERMKYAEQAHQQGKMRLAATLYLRVALTKNDKNGPAAKAALKQMADEGRSEMQSADELLAQGNIEEAMDKLDYLAWAYEEVPKFNEEIKSHVTRLHNDARYQAVINEKPAAFLVAHAQEHEQNDARCCAFWEYEEAAKLVPAPSAIKAQERYEAMKKDPEIVAEAEECKTLRECDQTLHKAELLKKSLPDKAELLLKEVIAKAPRDSEAHRDAVQMLAKMHPNRNK